MLLTGKLSQSMHIKIMMDQLFMLKNKKNHDKKIIKNKFMQILFCIPVFRDDISYTYSLVKPTTAFSAFIITFWDQEFILLIIWFLLYWKTGINTDKLKQFQKIAVTTIFTIVVNSRIVIRALTLSP